MIDENNNCVTKSKLTITVKTPSKYNDRRRVAAKQTKTNKQSKSHRQNIKRTKRHTYKQTHKSVKQRRG